jgi:hypothetical protein
MTNVLNFHKFPSLSTLDDQELEPIIHCPKALVRSKACYNVHSMRKEIFVAIVVGILVGLAITFGLYSLREQIFKNRTAETIEETRKQLAQPSPTPLSSISLQQPEQDLLTDEKTLKVVGRTLPGSYIVLLTPGNEYLTTADADGDFAHDVDLVAGGNRITIVVTSPDGKQETLVRNVVYSTVNLDVASTVSALIPATPSPTPSIKPTPTPKPTATPRPTATPKATPKL